MLALSIIGIVRYFCLDSSSSGLSVLRCWNDIGVVARCEPVRWHIVVDGLVVAFVHQVGFVPVPDCGIVLGAVLVVLLPRRVVGLVVVPGVLSK